MTLYEKLCALSASRGFDVVFADAGWIVCSDARFEASGDNELELHEWLDGELSEAGKQ